MLSRCLYLSLFFVESVVISVYLFSGILLAEFVHSLSSEGSTVDFYIMIQVRTEFQVNGK